MAKSKKRKTATKRKSIKKPAENVEPKGLFFLSLSLILFLSLISFVQDHPEQNYLGIIGYYLSLGLNFTMGFTSYLFIPLCIWYGYKLLTEKKNFTSMYTLAAFFSFAVCSSILLNVIAEHFPEYILTLQNKIYKETVFLSQPYPHTLIRLNLGGVLTYYLYADLPYFNLHNLLSTTGVVVIFSICALISFVMLTGVRIQVSLRTLFYLFNGIRRPVSLLLKGLYWLCKKGVKLALNIPSLFQKIPSGTSLAKPVERTISVSKTSFPKKKKNLSQIVYSHDAMFDAPNQNTSLALKKPISPPILQANTTEPKKVSSIFYELPSVSLLSNPPAIDRPLLEKELERQAEILHETLKSFGIEASVGNINCGPTITSFEVHPPIGVKVQKIKALENDIALNLQAKSIRIIAPIPGKAAVGVEIPSMYPQTVSLKELHIHYEQQKRKVNIPLLLGKTVSGDNVITDLAKMPHLLIAGATGSGKSVCINTLVMSILMNSSPDEIRLLMVDPKKVELTQYTRLPHMIAPVITEPHGAYSALKWLVSEMQKRYDILKQLGLRNIHAFNTRKKNKDIEETLGIDVPDKMPFMVAIIDEFADLMMVSSTDIETPIARIAQMARAVGIHLILATQRPSREVITGIIKANFPCRIAFKVANRVNSQIILDENGAEALLGNGDMLFLPPGSSHLIRAQGAYISDEDISNIIKEICKKYPSNYLIESFDALNKLNPDDEFSPKDKLYSAAISLVLQTRNASTTFLQRKLKIGYARAASLMDELEENGIIGPQEGGKPRRILAINDETETN